MLFNKNRLQVGGRVRIPQPILDSINMEVGDKIEIEYNDENEIIIKPLVE